MRSPRLPVSVWLATGLGVGLVAPAPGTVGAFWGLAWAWGLTGNPVALGLTTAIGVLGGVWLCGRAARSLGGDDPQAIVWDELATVPLVFVVCPASGVWQLVGFALHRLFDIGKPWPCRALERLPGGWGIMADDVAAAIYAGLSLRLLLWLG